MGSDFRVPHLQGSEPEGSGCKPLTYKGIDELLAVARRSHMEAARSSRGIFNLVAVILTRLASHFELKEASAIHQ